MKILLSVFFILFFLNIGCKWTSGVSGYNESEPAATGMENRVEEPAGDNCPYGGEQISSGQDLNGNGILDPNEVTQVIYLCDGQSCEPESEEPCEDPGEPCDPGVCAGNNAPVITSLEIEKGPYIVGYAYTVTLIVTHDDTGQTMEYDLAGADATQVGGPVTEGTTTTIQYTFTLSGGGPFSVEAVVSDGCQVVTRSLTGLKATVSTKEEAEEVLAEIIDLIMGVVDVNGDGVVENYATDLIMLDVATNNGQHTGNNSDWHEIANAAVLPSNQIVANLWAQSYRIIDRCNLVFESLAGICCMSQAYMNNLNGQVRFFRAYAYMNLYQLFGAVPILRTLQDTMNQVRPPLADVSAFIIEELKLAESLLPSTPVIDSSEINKYAASSLLARFYLYLGQWALAFQKASEVKDYAGKSLLPIYDEVFSTTAENETIWRLDYSATKPNRLSYYAFEPPDGIKEYTARDDLVDLYVPLDKRNGSTIIKPNSDYIVNKYRNAVTGDWDIPVIRYAEILLIVAESSWQMGQDTSAKVYCDLIRDRAGLSATLCSSNHPTLFSDILQERRLELAFEGHWFHDLRRLGIASTVMNGLSIPFVAGKDELFPIPAEVLTANPLLVQNPGY